MLSLLKNFLTNQQEGQWEQFVIQCLAQGHFIRCPYLGIELPTFRIKDYSLYLLSLSHLVSVLQLSVIVRLVKHRIVMLKLENAAFHML